MNNWEFQEGGFKYILTSQKMGEILNAAKNYTHGHRHGCWASNAHEQVWIRENKWGLAY